MTYSNFTVAFFPNECFKKNYQIIFVGDVLLRNSLLAFFLKSTIFSKYYNDS